MSISTDTNNNTDIELLTMFDIENEFTGDHNEIYQDNENVKSNHQNKESNMDEVGLLPNERDNRIGLLEVEEKRVSAFREVLPQFLANTVVNMALLDLSIILNFSTVLIADLHHAKGPLSLDDRAASWIASLAYICQPVGSLMSGILVEKLGRKGGILVVNIPYLLAWVLYWTAPNVTMLFLANLLTGITVGLTEAPLSNYGGEMTQPHIRGTVTSIGSIFLQLGTVMDSLLLALTDWRTTAAICSSVPIISFLLMLLLPETPPYLVSHGRIKEAEKSLCWLRGWVKPSAVQGELQELINHHDIQSPLQIRTTGETYEPLEERREFLRNDPPGNKKKEIVLRRALQTVLELLKPATLRPLMLVMPLFACSNLTGMTSIRPYIVRVFRAFRPPMDPEWMTVMCSVTNVVASIILIFIVHILGKRRLCLFFTAISAFTASILGTYSFIYHDEGQESWIPFLLFIVLAYSSTSVAYLPWMMLCEIFPFRTRGLAIGVSAAGVYLIVFCADNVYLRMEKTLGLHGSFWFFGAFNFMGLVYLYYTMLDTEGKTLYEIECHFRQGLFLK